jgi:regulator of protease activity HflC (stomatin/prohibitin superfamily)
MFGRRRDARFGVYRHGMAGARMAAVFGTAPSGGMVPADGAVRRGRAVTVGEWQRALLFRHGQLKRLLEPGRHRFWEGGLATSLIDLRPWVLTLPVQEIPTADGVPVKVTVAGQAKVAEPVAYVTSTRDPDQFLYLAVQVALRDLVAGLQFDEVLAARGSLGERLTAAVTGLDRIGVAVEQLTIKDIMLPGELKKAQAEVLVARAQGIAALERARGETAALRSLANAARLAAGNPALLQLRLLQQLATSAGHTVIFGTPQAPALGQLLSAAPEDAS